MIVSGAWRAMRPPVDGAGAALTHGRVEPVLVLRSPMAGPSWCWCCARPWQGRAGAGAALAHGRAEPVLVLVLVLVPYSSRHTPDLTRAAPPARVSPCASAASAIDPYLPCGVITALLLG